MECLRIISHAFARAGKLRCVFVAACCLLLGAATLTPVAQAATVSVTDATSSFTVINPTYAVTDVPDDAQTGDKYADFVSTTANPGFYIEFGQIAGQDVVIFRFIMEEYSAKKGFTGTLRVGMDADGDGAIDLFFGPSISNSGTSSSSSGVFIQYAGTGANDAPSTTTIGTNFNGVAITSSNYDYIGLSDGTAQLTFAVSFSSIQSALDALGITITADSFVRFVAFTSQQATSNSINQDILGVNGGTTSSTTFDNLGAFSDYITSTGAPVPELSSFSYAAGLIFMGMIFQTRRRRQSTPVQAA